MVSAASPFTLADLLGSSSALTTPDRDVSGYPHARYRTTPAAASGPHTVNDLFTDGGDVDTHAVLRTTYPDGPAGPVQRIVEPGESVLGHETVRAKMEELLDGHVKQSTGSATRVMRAIFLAEELSFDAGEI